MLQIIWNTTLIQWTLNKIGAVVPYSMKNEQRLYFLTGTTG